MFVIFIEASGLLSTASNKQRVAILLNLVGKKSLDQYYTFTFENSEDNRKIESMVKVFENYCNQRKIFVAFINRLKKNESIEEFVAACHGCMLFPCSVLLY